MTSDKSSPTALPPATLTNETLRQRILIGGSKPDAAPPRGTLAKAASRFRELSSALQSADTNGVEDATTALRSELALHDLEMRKLFLSAKAYDAAASQSRASLSTMTSSRTSIQSDIETLTAELNHQKRIKRNREEYNTLAKMMNSSHPAATKTRMDLKAVQEEIARTKEEVERAKWEVSVKEKQIRVVMTSLGDLREVLRDEDWRKRRSDEALSTVADAKDGEDGCVADDDEGNKRTKTSD
eukprot:scaffold88416_cov54-Cyclotella_meneghiniana.AAC.2